jgi:DNA-binding NtrC family response regulator
VTRVLVIDDEAPIRLLCRVNLEAEGMEVIGPQTGEPACRRRSAAEAQAGGSTAISIQWAELVNAQNSASSLPTRSTSPSTR